MTTTSQLAAQPRPTHERRSLTVRPEVRAERDDGTIPVAGYAAKFNKLSQPLDDWWVGRFVEQIAPGAFTKTIAEHDIRLLINHNPDLVLSRSTAGSLNLVEDGVGLAFDAEMTPTTYARDLATNMRAGNVDQMSFAFRVIQDDWDETDEGTPRRTLREVKLFDISVVTFPAYLDTEAALRSQQFEALLMTLGLDRIPEQERSAFLTDLISREVDPSRLHVLRAARNALGDLVATAEPVMDHSARLELLRRQTEQRKFIAIGVHDA